MNLRQIEAFRTVMLAGSVTAAAHLLQVTQPTISKLIAQLERQTKLKLFDRVRRHLVPRSEARALLQEVEKVLRALDDVGRSARHLARGDRGHIRIGAHPSIGTGFLPKAVASFLATRPEITVTLHVRESSYIKEWVAARTADVGFVSDDSPEAVGTIAARFQELPGAVCILPKGHKLAKQKILRPKHFSGERIVSIGRDPNFRSLIERAFVDSGIERKIIAETNHFATACSLVAEGAGVSVVDPYSAFSFHGYGGVVLRQFSPAIKFIVNTIRPAGQPVSVIVDEFLTHVAKHKEAMDRRLKEILVAGVG